MMKTTILLIFTFLISTTISAQVITYEDFQGVIPYVQKEDFKGAFERTSQLLHSTKNDSSNLRGIITYMNILSAAGMVSLDQMTYEDFSKNANKYVGQYLVMPAHPCTDSSSNAFNSLKFLTKEGQLQGSTAAANKLGTTIFIFEYYQYADKIDPVDLIGKNVRCGGILQSFETNPNKSKVWISRLYITNAFARAMTPR